MAMMTVAGSQPLGALDSHFRVRQTPRPKSTPCCGFGTATGAGRLIGPPSNHRATHRPRPAPIVCGKRERRPFSRPVSSLDGKGGLFGSLFNRWTGDIPEEGRFLTKEEEFCDPMHRYCGDPYYVYEGKCAACHGTGSVRSGTSSRRGGRQTLITCLQCHGVGVTRSVTTRFVPNEQEGAMSLGRTNTKHEEQEDAAAAPSSPAAPPRRTPVYYPGRKGRSAAQSSNGNGAAPGNGSAESSARSSNGNGAPPSFTSGNMAAGGVTLKPSPARH